MKPLIIIGTKIMEKLLNMIGRGSVLPGEIALKLNKNIMSYFKLPKITIFITGTTGKHLYQVSLLVCINQTDTRWPTTQQVQI